MNYGILGKLADFNRSNLLNKRLKKFVTLSIKHTITPGIFKLRSNLKFER